MAGRVRDRRRGDARNGAADQAGAGVDRQSGGQPGGRPGVRRGPTGSRQLQRVGVVDEREQASARARHDPIAGQRPPDRANRVGRGRLHPEPHSRIVQITVVVKAPTAGVRPAGTQLSVCKDFQCPRAALNSPDAFTNLTPDPQRRYLWRIRRRAYRRGSTIDQVEAGLTSGPRVTPSSAPTEQTLRSVHRGPTSAPPH